MSALERYRSLLATAEDLEKMAGESNFGGATFWSNAEESTREAVRDPKWKPNSESIGMIHPLGPDACQAIHAAFTMVKMEELWRDAAQILRKRAAGMKGSLVEQAEALAFELKAME